jgi:hypothetical protein
MTDFMDGKLSFGHPDEQRFDLFNSRENILQAIS